MGFIMHKKMIKFYRKLIFINLLFLVSAQSIIAQNVKPSVNAGDDSEYKVNNINIQLFGDASDDGKPNAELTLQWKKISGPEGVNIFFPNDAITKITFTNPGNYIFELSAFDGQLTSRDSVQITIVTNLPFIIIAPKNNQEIQIGKPFIIEWQRDPPAGCEIFYTIDNGKTNIPLTTGSVEGPTFIWNVPSTLQPGTSGKMTVRRYDQQQDRVEGTFVLVDRPPQKAFSFSKRFDEISSFSIDSKGNLNTHGKQNNLFNITISQLNGKSIYKGTFKNGTTLKMRQTNNVSIVNFRNYNQGSSIISKVITTR